MRKLVLPLVALAAIGTVIAVVLVACGAGGDSEATAISADEWRETANAVCLDVGPKAKAIARPKTEDQVAEFTSAVIPLWDRERTEIRALGVPDGMATEARDLLTAMDYLNAALLEIHIATQRYDGVRRFYAVQKSRDAARDIKLRSKAMGLPACASQRIP